MKYIYFRKRTKDGYMLIRTLILIETKNTVFTGVYKYNKRTFAWNLTQTQKERETEYLNQ